VARCRSHHDIAQLIVTDEAIATFRKQHAAGASRTMSLMAFNVNE